MSETSAHEPPPTAAKYRGVRKRKWGKYVAEIRLPNSRERIWLGSYDTAEKAARAFDAALFCLRGRAANFNFSHDPPEIAGGQSLSPPEIQAAAQRYGNSYGGGQQEAAPADGGEKEFPARAIDLDNGATPSERAGQVDLIDGSFWEMVDMNGRGAAGHNSGCVSDFELFVEPGEMYVHPHYNEPIRVYEDEDEGYDHGLWNF